ncbi:MAG: histidinol dehydrogenase [Bacteroidales bacterium]|nr:histidinol dehydrogenase [Bacteroidales bacterium]
MDIVVTPPRSLWPGLCVRPSDENQEVRERVETIISRVRADGDRALRELAYEIDGFVPDSIEVTAKEIEDACKAVDESLKSAIKDAVANIRAFHEAQMPRQIEVLTSPGVRCIQKPVAIGKVGLYVPGGTAPLFSTVLMLAVPAKIAGCREIVLCTPCGKDGKIPPAVLYAASFCGIDRIFRIGGAQAVAAMACGTRSVPRVDKIFGPGNQYVTTAKQMLGNREVAIDMPAGPSEVMVIVDRKSNPAFAAADLLSQAEHGRDSQVILLSTDASAAETISAEVERQVEVLGRAGMAKAALSQSHFVVLENEEDIIDFANIYAPEHLIISTENPWSIADRITSAGSVFVGEYAPESAGDYASGTNHTLPTGGWARSCSGVNIDSYMRKMTIQEISREGIAALTPTIVAMADAEGLQAHANAAKIRNL